MESFYELFLQVVLWNMNMSVSRRRHDWLLYEYDLGCGWKPFKLLNNMMDMFPTN